MKCLFCKEEIEDNKHVCKSCAENTTTGVDYNKV